MFVLAWLAAASNSATRSLPQDTREARQLVCQKLKAVEVEAEKEGTIAVRTPAEIPLDAKFVSIQKSTITVQPLEDRDKPALGFQTSQVVKTTPSTVHAVKATNSYVDALALDRTTGRMVISRAMAGDSASPGAKGYIAYFQCTRPSKR